MVEVKSKYEEVRKDLLKDLKDVMLRKIYFTHKYRSKSESLNVHVGLFTEEDLTNVLQIYVGNNNYRIREKIYINNKYQIEGLELTIKQYEKN